MNVRQQLTATFLFSILFANAGLSQVSGGQKRLTLRSDFPAKSVLVSSTNQQVGEKSPFLVAAALTESGNQKEIRSLLQFNYDYLPPSIIKDPTSITKAELVLYPATADFFSNNYDAPGKLVVSRIIENWFDTCTYWDNQPMVDTVAVTKLKVRIRKKTPEIRVTVTSLVVDMIIYGNKGFMIRQNNSEVTNTLTGLSFASSLNDDKLLRPLLVLTYYDVINYSPDNSPNPGRPVSTPVYTIPPRIVTSSSNGPE